MSRSHDPYRELEDYLEKAQEEIRKTFDELTSLESKPLSPSLSSDDYETYLQPPVAFRSSHVLCCNSLDRRTRNFEGNTLKRVCFEGNVVDLEQCNARKFLLHKSYSCSETKPYTSKLDPDLSLLNGKGYSDRKHICDTSPRQSTKLLYSSLSCSEDSTDLHNFKGRSSDVVDAHVLHNGYVNVQRKSIPIANGSAKSQLSPFYQERRTFRQRSYSESSPSKHFHLALDDHQEAFPRPPSGDVNLLSIWADNLVLAIDKTLGEELDESAGSHSPLSDCSTSPLKNKVEESTLFNSRSTTKLTETNSSVVPKTLSLKENGVSFSTSSDSKLLTYPSDESLQLETPLSNGNCGQLQSCHIDCITSPPSDFKDKINHDSLHNQHIAQAETLSTVNSGKKDAGTQVRNTILKVSNVLSEESESESDVSFVSKAKEMHRLARVVPFLTTELECCAAITTTCASGESQCKGTIFNGIDDKHVLCSEENNSRIFPDHKTLDSTIDSQETEDRKLTIRCNSDSEHRLSELPFTLPRHHANFTEAERYSFSVPRDAGRVSLLDDENGLVQRQRSSSSSFVSSLSQVSMDELAAFMRKVKKSTYHPPPRADVCIDTKDNQNVCSCDAVTQTTPVVPLSRSSSFTWVTECDCSDWNFVAHDSCSEESLPHQCKQLNNSNVKNSTSQDSTSPSPTTDDEVFEANQNSDSSSLYLSACSVTSDSSSNGTAESENALIDACSSTNYDASQEVSGVEEVTTISVKSLSSTGTLMNIPEESTYNETMSLRSVTSCQSDNVCLGQPASFPSTLKSSKSKNKARPLESDVYRTQPIEANVLIVNDRKSVSAPVSMPLSLNGETALESSSNESSPSSETRSSSGKFPESEVSASPIAFTTKELNELQAIEACSWLRAAGFPQYAQMYEDNLFPIDICTAQKDHAFLHPDSIQSLFRRLNTLNRCARMKFADTAVRKAASVDESDDEEQCALSENWQFQRISRRWSRVPSPTHSADGVLDGGKRNECAVASLKLGSHTPPVRKYLTPEEAYSSSHDSVFVEEHHSSPDSVRKSLRSDDHLSHVPGLREGGNSPGSSSGSGGTISIGTEDMLEKPWQAHSKHLHRSGSDRIKEGAKALLRRMESLKGKRKKKIIAKAHSEKTRDYFMAAGLNSGTDGSSCSSLTPSPRLQCRIEVSSPQDESGCSYECSAPTKPKKKVWGSLYCDDPEISAHSDSECSMFVLPDLWKDAKYSDAKQGKQSITPKKVQMPKNKSGITQSSLADALQASSSHYEEAQHKKKLGDPPSPQLAEKLLRRTSHYDNLPAPLVMFNEACVENLDRDDYGKAQGLTVGTSDAGGGDIDDGEIIIISSERRDSGVGASLTRRSSHLTVPWHSFLPKPPPILKTCAKHIPITNLSAPQILVLRKLSLLKLTTLMEKFSPSSRTGWSWAVPKFIRRIRTPDYKDKAVFGVPLLLILQRTGHPLPASIQAAIQYLQKTALDSTGLFRKSGVRSRIQKLRNQSESNPDKASYEEQQPYDVADMLKQYFRELPEALLTNKLSETFISIFQYIPEELRLEAIQAAVLLMPDENREVLQSLLCFLQEVCQHSGENQMTATNIAVCFAPSLFHLSSPRSASASPRRRKTVGAPDLKELNENRAAYECLASMVLNYRTLCAVPKDLVSKSRLPCMDNYEPATIEELSTLVHRDTYGWSTYVECCINSMLKESKDKYKGWINVPQSDIVDLAYKKVGDGHPLRLWKVSTEVEAPPTELLNRILRERHIWDTTFTKWKVVQTLDRQTEVYQFTVKSISPHPPCDYCIIRSWKTDLPKGACVLIEASVDHPNAHLMIDGVRAVMLVSRYLIEHCGSGKSRITYINRVDTRGRSPEWYNRAYGHICAMNIIKLRDSFSHIRTGPETKV